MRIVLFARILEAHDYAKFHKNLGLLSNFVSLSKIRNAHFGRCGPLGVKGCIHEQY